MELVWKHQIWPYNPKNLNSHSRISRQLRILENLIDFSKHVGTPNKFSPNSNSVFSWNFNSNSISNLNFLHKRKVVHNESIYTHVKLGEFWSLGRVNLVIYKKHLSNELGPTQLNSGLGWCLNRLHRAQC
jgi:hypothetical protein